MGETFHHAHNARSVWKKLWQHDITMQLEDKD